MDNENIVTIIMGSAIVFLIAYCLYWKKKKKDEESNLIQDESKQHLNYSTMADKKSSADVKMQDESKQSLNHSTMADKKSIADVKMQDESKESLNPSTMAVKESSADVKMQDVSKEFLNPLSMAVKESSVDSQFPELNQHEHLIQRLEQNKQLKQTVPQTWFWDSHMPFRRIPVFYEEDDLFSTDEICNFRRKTDEICNFRRKTDEICNFRRKTKLMKSNLGAQFQEVLFTGNPVDKGGEPRIRHPIKQQRPKIVRDIVPTVINPDLQDPTERRA